MYAGDSEFDDKKFGFVMCKVFLLMLDYHIRSRDIDVKKLAQVELQNLNTPVPKDKAIKVRVAACLSSSFVIIFVM